MLRSSHRPRLDLAPARDKRDRLMASAQAAESGAVSHGTAAPESAKLVRRVFAFMFNLTNTASDRIELASRQRRPVTVNMAAPAQFVFSLFIVFALAKLLVILDRHLAFSPLVVFALLGQDALFAVAAGLLLAVIASRFPVVSWSTCAFLCVYAAFNVPLTRALSSPLTLQISQA